MKRRSSILAATLVGALLSTSAVVAQDPSPGHSMLAPDVKPVGGFVVAADTIGYPSGHDFSAVVAPGSGVQTVEVTVPPGFDFGWHHHNSFVVVSVTQGSLTLIDTACERQQVAAGEGFLEEAGVVHRALNEGSADAVIVGTYLGVPADQSPDAMEPAPSGCPDAS